MTTNFPGSHPQKHSVASCGHGHSGGRDPSDLSTLTGRKMAEGAKVVDGREGGEGIRGEQHRAVWGTSPTFRPQQQAMARRTQAIRDRRPGGGTPEGARREKSARYHGEGEGADSRKKSPRQGLKMTATRRHSLLTAGNDVRPHCGV